MDIRLPPLAIANRVTGKISELMREGGESSNSGFPEIQFSAKPTTTKNKLIPIVIAHLYGSEYS